MDTSKEYVSMCRKSSEIQEMRNGRFPEKGDFFNHPLPLGGNEYTWLPRQDQLQEMISNECSIYQTLDCFILFWQDECYLSEMEQDMLKYYSSMEQLWLAFVMKDKFNKQWNGEDWIASVS